MRIFRNGNLQKLLPIVSVNYIRLKEAILICCGYEALSDNGTLFKENKVLSVLRWTVSYIAKPVSRIWTYISLSVIKI